MKTIIAIDQGQSGAIAWKDRLNNIFVVNMPETRKDILDFFECNFGMIADECQAFYERVGGYVPGNSGPAAVKFARHCECIEMSLLACRIPAQEILPSKWQAWLIGKPDYPKISKDVKGPQRKKILSDRKRDRKNRIKIEIQRRYPDLKVTLNNADALGLLCYALSLG